ncbi:putative multidrug resistance protein isoform X2 [Phalaenopsis equestris]|uniref:putative multidrug resistance protein isoform X2 n=1 Tax=Phalaenopsis equestris TaxID=78828 RepID=UPI0009E38FD5|nr:putative multidrug resistance protein isoform X2 [Phalaenopsis equestris]
MEVRGERSKPSIIWAARSLFMHADHADCWLMGLGFIGSVGDGLTLPISIVVFYKMVNALGAGPSSPDFEHGVNQSSLQFVYVAAGGFLFAFLEGYCWTRTGERQARRMRGRYLKAVLRQEVGYFDLKKDGSTAEVVNCVSTDSFVIQDVLSEKVPNFIMNTATFVSSYIAAFLLQWRLTLIAFPTVLLLIIPGLIYGRVLLTLSRQIHVQYNKAGLIAEQAISSVRTVYSCVTEPTTISSFSSALNSSVRLGIRQALAKGLAFGSNGVTFSIWALMAWYGGRLVILHDVKGGSIFAAGSSVINGGLALGLGLSNVKYLGEGIAAAERIKEVMDRKPAIDSESDEGEEVREVRGEVEFKKVRFWYPARPEVEVFRGFSLRVEAGRTAALVGGSGSGKSTAVALLQRFYDPTGGGIVVDGVDIRRLKVKWLRGIMGMVSQEPLLFDMSIKENVLFGKEEGSLEDVVEAAKKANAHGFIYQLPMGYDTQVGERGVQLSGGQKQRIAIARALIRQPKILLLDEATSALDSESERLVQEALDVAAVGRTTIVIAHRLSTIRNAHSIAFVDAGEVVETGSHEELIADPNSHYSALIRAQRCQPAEDHESLGSRSMSRRFSISSSTKSLGEMEELNEGNDKSGRSPSRSVPSLRRLLMMNAPEWGHALLGGTGAILFGAVQPAYSYALSSMLMVYFIKDHEEMKEKIRTYALIFVGLSVFSFVVSVVQHYHLGVMGECLTKRVRERMLAKILTFEVGWFDQEDNSSGAICSRLAKDAAVVRSLVGDRMSLIIQALTAVTVAFAMGVIIAWRLAIIIIATQPLIITCFYARRVLLKNISGKSIKSQSESSKLAAEAVNNLRTITSFSSQPRILRLFNLSQSNPRRHSLRQSYLAGLGLALSQSLNICTWALDFWYGGILVRQGLISSKALLQTFVIVVSTGRVIADAGSTTTDLAKGSHSVASVFSILDRFSAIEPDDPDGCHQPNSSLTGSIEFRGVDFAYPARPDVPILHRFSLAIQAGKSTALVGPSGSGKSTIISLVERFYDATAGHICVDGRDIRSYNLRALRRQIALVGQEPAMFAGTIRENITYGLDGAVASEAEAAARVANAHDFISGLKDGYETWCGERGIQLSGGQKQRIAIARAVLRNPKILLLDEATSALDGKSENVVVEALERVMVGRTSVVVAHRLGTVRNCDLIAVMDKGRLVEKGSHAALMGKGETGMYWGLVRLQHGGESGKKG